MVMVGLAETFFPLFVLALYDSAAASGLVITLPVLIAAILQLAARRIVVRVGWYRRTVVGFAILQTAACVPLAGIAFAGALGHVAPAWATFAIATVYYCGAVVAGPIWTAWMARLTPEAIRTRFFAVRNRWLQVSAVVGVVVGAVALEWAERAGAAGSTPTLLGQRIDSLPLLAFGCIFLLAGVMRAISAQYLHAHDEVRCTSAQERPVSNAELSRRFLHGDDGRLVLTLVLFQAALMVASPFWHAYVKQHLGVSFVVWAMFIAIQYAARAVAMEWGGTLGARLGARRLLVAGAWAMVPTPLLWLVSDSVAWMLVAVALGGIAAALYELGVLLMLLHAIDRDERTSVLSRYHLLNHAAGALGSGAGGAALEQANATRSAFVGVFIASGVLRLAGMGLFARLRSSPPRERVRATLGDAEAAEQNG